MYIYTIDDAEKNKKIIFDGQASIYLSVEQNSHAFVIFTIFFFIFKVSQ